MSEQTNCWDMKMTDPMNRVWQHPRGYLEGHVVTKHGIVYVYSQGSGEEVPSTNLQFVWNGRLYSRSIGKRYTQRGCATIANRFAGKVSREHP